VQRGTVPVEVVLESFQRDKAAAWTKVGMTEEEKGGGKISIGVGVTWLACVVLRALSTWP